MAGERNLGRGRSTKKVVSFKGPRNAQGIRYGKTGQPLTSPRRGSTRGPNLRTTQILNRYGVNFVATYRGVGEEPIIRKVPRPKLSPKAAAKRAPIKQTPNNIAGAIRTPRRHGGLNVYGSRNLRPGGGPYRHGR